MPSGSETPLSLRTSRAALLARELENEIVNDHAHGDRIGTIGDLRTRFGVGVATVNEALARLETKGLIEVRPGVGGGVFVTPPSARLASAHAVLGIRSDSRGYEDSLEVRSALEPLIVRHAASHSRAADIRAYHKLLDQMEGSVDDPPAFFKYNWALHRRIAKPCRNEQLRRMYLMVVDVLESSIDSSEFEIFDGDSIVAVHRDLVGAIEAGDGELLEEAIAAHSSGNRIQLQAVGGRRSR
jgi:DNA-binding FadR family transcriptional regulator